MLFFLSFTLMCPFVSSGQGSVASATDSAAIRQTALDYIEGYYSGDAVRMERAIHPDLNKATPRGFLGQNWCAYYPHQHLELEYLLPTLRVDGLPQRHRLFHDQLVGIACAEVAVEV
jgi:hypothetical protein